MKLYIIGDSHVEALHFGFNFMRRTGVPLPSRIELSFCNLGNGFHMAQPFWERDGSTIRMSRDDYATSLLAATGVAGIARVPGTAFGLCMGMHTARVFRDPMWKNFAPWKVADPGKETPVSVGLIERIVDNDSKYIIGFIRALRETGIPMVVISAPPPHRGHLSIAKDGLRYSVVAEVDRIYRLRIAKLLDDLEVPYVTPPRDACDEAGFIRRKYRLGVSEDDPHHGNVEYGHRMMARIFRRVHEVRSMWNGSPFEQQPVPK